MEALVIIGFWILWCVLGAKITTNKGRGGGGGFALGLLLGPIGLLIALLLPRQKDGA